MLLVACLILQCSAWAVSAIEEASNYTSQFEGARERLRVEGVCVKRCGFGSDLEQDGFATVMRLYRRFQEGGEFADFLEEIGEEDLLGADLIDEILQEHFELSPDERIDLVHALLHLKQGEQCLDYCRTQSRKDWTPSFESMSLVHQQAEECLLGFKEKSFDITEDLGEIVAAFRKDGFVVIKNAFPESLIRASRDVLDSWRRNGTWGGLAYEDYSDSKHLHTSDNRDEVVLPVRDPFTTLLTMIDSSKVMEILQGYSDTSRVQLEFVSSILSRPGASTQLVHSDYAFPRSLLKLNIALQDMQTENGPTALCPCTHLHGNTFDVYNIDGDGDGCPVQYKPKSVAAGTLTIYDQSLLHHGTQNTGKTDRWILDVSYTSGDIHSSYHDAFRADAARSIFEWRQQYRRGDD